MVARLVGDLMAHRPPGVAEVAAAELPCLAVAAAAGEDRPGQLLVA